MRMYYRPKSWLAACLLTSAASTFASPCAEQPTKPGMEAFCGVTAPEDLVLFDDRFVIMSSMEPTAHLYVFDTQSDVLSVMDTTLRAPIETTLKAANDLAPWGDARCSPPEQMATHGLDLTQRASGEWQLLAVNHGGRESIEYFSVEPASATGAPSLQWRGCVMAAENAQFNDVAGLPGGGFLATDPISASWQLPKILGGALGVGSGRVYRWDSENAYRAVPNTQGAYPNGITLSADKQSFYVNYYQEGEVREHDLESGEILNRQAVERPDNSTLTADGTLLVASHHASLFTLLVALTSAENERTTIPYSIIAIDTASFNKSVRFHSDGEEMGAGTVGLPVGDDLYVGSFRGDRLIRVRSPAAPAPRTTLEN